MKCERNLRISTNWNLNPDKSHEISISTGFPWRVMDMSQVCNNLAEIAATITVRIIEFFRALDSQSGEG
jgi:hypothetical protein